MQYMAEKKSMEEVYIALQANLSFRHDLLERCHYAINSMDDAIFPFFSIPVPSADGSVDVLEHALNYKDEDEEFSRFDNANPHEWKVDADILKEEYDPFLDDVQSATVVNGQRSNDLDLFWDIEDEWTLFDYKSGSWGVYCDIARANYALTDSSNQKYINTIMLQMPEFNYLSENEIIRIRLYQICKLDQNQQTFSQKSFYEDYKNFENLFM